MAATLNAQGSFHPGAGRPGAMHRIVSTLTGYATRVPRLSRENADIRALSRLSDRELYDLGLSRSDIPTVVRDQHDGARVRTYKAGGINVPMVG